MSEFRDGGRGGDRDRGPRRDRVESREVTEDLGD